MTKLHIKDPGSAITHFIAMVLAIFAATPLLFKAYHDTGAMTAAALAVFIASMILLYAASTVYHTQNHHTDRGVGASDEDENHHVINLAENLVYRR